MNDREPDELPPMKFRLEEWLAKHKSRKPGGRPQSNLEPSGYRNRPKQPGKPRAGKKV